MDAADVLHAFDPIHVQDELLEEGKVDVLDVLDDSLVMVIAFISNGLPSSSRSIFHDFTLA